MTKKISTKKGFYVVVDGNNRLRGTLFPKLDEAIAFIKRSRSKYRSTFRTYYVPTITR